MSLEFSKPNARILVVGDLMIDHYLWGGVDRISPEAPVPVVDIHSETETLGGAGNVVANLLAFGAEVTVASVVGDDENGVKIRNLITNLGLDASCIIKEIDRKTSRKSRLMGGHQQVIRFDMETKSAISDASETILLSSIASIIGEVDVVLISDYGKGVLRNGVCQGVIASANALGIKVLVDPKGKDYTKYHGAYTVTPNRKEATQATEIAIIDDVTLESALEWLKEHVGLAVATVTLSDEGIAFLDTNGTVHKLPTFAKDVYDVTGAGDTVLAALGYALANNWSMEAACRFANLAAAVVVGKVGSATATITEVQTLLHSLAPQAKMRGLVNNLWLRDRVRQAQADGQTVVFTNGCFDILHVGHITLLQEAKSFGDILIVGINADASVARLKGPTRPINAQDDRAILLSALACVDYVVLFTEDTPYTLLELLRPDILVKGGDYTKEQVIGRELVKEVRLVYFVPGKSTTSILAKL